MGKGPDQGDFETPTADTSSPEEPWPTDPADAAAPLATPTGVPSSTPGDTTASTAAENGPGDVGQLPTTSGTDPVVSALAAVTALALVGAGLVMALRKRGRPDW